VLAQHGNKSVEITL